MKRGLKLVLCCDIVNKMKCPNPGPDEEGIETQPCLPFFRGSMGLSEPRPR